MKRKIFLLIFVLLLSGCGAGAGAAAEAETTVAVTLPPPTEETVPPEVTQEALALMEAPLPAVPVVLECLAPGTLEERGDSAVIDYSNTADGYVMAQYFGETDKRLKLRVTGPTTTYTYNLPVGQWTVFPLSDGEGTYKVSIYRNTTGFKYSIVMSTTFPVTLADEFAPFLRPNQYVNYVDAPKTLAAAQMLCAGLEHPLDKVAAVYDYVVSELAYDEEKAAAVKSGYLPVLDEVLESKKGICFDYAAVMAAMLRSQEVPCKLVVGYAGTIYHAWISVWTEENGWVDGVIFFDGHAWKRMDPTFASYGQRSEEIMQYIEADNYVTKYLY